MPIVTDKRYVNPCLWAGCGVLISGLSSAASRVLAPSHVDLALVIDALLVGLLVGLLRFMHGEWKLRIEQLLSSRGIEVELADSLMLLRYSKDESTKARALAHVVGYLKMRAVLHDNFLAHHADESLPNQ